MDWITGGFTLLAMELVARRRWEGWAVGLGNQACWLWVIVDRRLWGLPLTVALIWRYSVALRKWKSG